MQCPECGEYLNILKTTQKLDRVIRFRGHTASVAMACAYQCHTVERSEKKAEDVGAATELDVLMEVYREAGKFREKIHTALGRVGDEVKDVAGLHLWSARTALVAVETEIAAAIGHVLMALREKEDKANEEKA